MTPEQMEQDFHFLRSCTHRLSRLIDALESSPLLIQAMGEPSTEGVSDMPKAADEDIRTLADIERDAIVNAHSAYGRNFIGASKALGISKTTYYHKLREYGVRG